MMERTLNMENKQQSEGNDDRKYNDVGLPPMVPVKPAKGVVTGQDGKGMCVDMRNEGHREEQKQHQQHGKQQVYGKRRDGKQQQYHGKQHQQHGKQQQYHGKQHQQHGKQQQYHGKQHQQHGKQQQYHGKQDSISQEKVNNKLEEVTMTRKIAAHVDRRRKWPMKALKSESSGISQTSARMLFHCSCQLLKNQSLEFDVRAREMEERNAAQMREIQEWEKRIRSLKRELEEYTDEQVLESRDRALVKASHVYMATRGTRDEQRNALPSTTVGLGAVETSLPPAVIATEAKLQDELHKRTQKVKDFYKSVPGFIKLRDEQTSRYF
ncbi:unnamed protein product [Peronospora belbahrii]|uniref:Uncharacterized protein n=1 Tax=Peronospora belbahrii TaxID=622444 RepID=A0AAU9LK27_9STRA|nr:unnamed protein product [Peronospora belbahrii]